MQQQDNHEYPFLYQRQTCHQVQPNQATYQKRSEERFSRNAETDLVCRLLLEKKNTKAPPGRSIVPRPPEPGDAEDEDTGETADDTLAAYNDDHGTGARADGPHYDVARALPDRVDPPLRLGIAARRHQFFFFNDTATTEIYTLSLHDALPIFLSFISGRLATKSNQIKQLIR